jgi:hypothetical protein
MRIRTVLQGCNGSFVNVTRRIESRFTHDVNSFKSLDTLSLSSSLFPVHPTLEHRASAKRFVSLQFLNLRHSVGLLGRVISPSQGRYLTHTQNKHKQNPCLSSGIRTNDPSLRVSKDSLCLKPRRHCDRHVYH